MIPVMVVPLLRRPDLLYAMVDSIDVDVEHLVIIDNGTHTNRPRCMVNRHIRHSSLVRLPANLGVAGSWNLGIKVTPFAPWWLIVNFDVTWPAGSLAAFAEQAGPDRLVLSGGAPEWCAFALGSQVVERVGLFDEALHPAYFEDTLYEKACEQIGATIVRSSIPVDHRNSSTLYEGFTGRNALTYQANMDYYRSKVASGDMRAGGFDLVRRRALSWD